mgnify:CR=1 FL=1
MKKKFLALALTAVMALSLAACGGDTQSTDTDADTSGDESASGSQTYTVGIIQQVQHEALDAATQGFQDALTELLGDSVTIDPQNASGDTANCTTIANNFVSQGVDLIMANGTTALQAAATGTSTIPILGTSITEYGVALGIDGFTGTTGYNVSGTSDLAPLDQQAAMLQELFPDAENVGLLYCSAEPNSVFQVETIQGYLEEMGYTCTQYAFTDVNDLSAVTQSACDGSDVIYIPTDNTAANNTETIANVVIPAGVPVVCGESGICSGCGVATLSISYEELGRITGEMAVQILTGEADISTMPIEYTDATPKYNPTMCEALGLTPPDGYEAIKDGRLYGTVDQDPGLYAEKTMELIVGYLHGDITELEDQYMLEFPIVTQENIDEYGPAGWD